MSTKIKQEFLDSVPVAKVKEYRECLEKRGRPSKKCVPIREELKAFKAASKPASKSVPKPAPKAKPSKPMTVADKCKKTPIKKCEKPCKVFKTPNGKYCRKAPPGPKKSSKQEKKTLSMMP